MLRAALLVLGAGTVLAQVLLPVLASQEAARYPELAGVAVPYAAAGIVAIAFGQAALLAVWRLAGLVADGTILTPRARPWLDRLAAAAAFATTVTTATLLHLLMVMGVGGPGVVLALAAALVGGTTSVLLVVLVRGVVASATAPRDHTGGS